MRPATLGQPTPAVPAGPSTVAGAPLCIPRRPPYDAPAMAFHCDIVTPDREVFKHSVSSVVLPAHDGQIGILTNRAPLLVRLGEGTLTAQLANNGGERAYHVRGGVAQMKGNHLTVLTEKASDAQPVAGAS